MKTQITTQLGAADNEKKDEKEDESGGNVATVAQHITEVQLANKPRERQEREALTCSKITSKNGCANRAATSLGHNPNPAQPCHALMAVRQIRKLFSDKTGLRARG